MFHVPTGDLVSVNGSSKVAQCLLYRAAILATCYRPSASVLFDGNIPTLTGLDGNMWASQLLTLHTLNTFTVIFLDFTNALGYVGVERVTMVMFNCPEWGIYVTTVGVSVAPTATDKLSAVGDLLLTINSTSCDSLVTFSAPLNTTALIVALYFNFHPDADWMHLAFSSPSSSPVTTDVTSSTNCESMIIMCSY